MKKTIKNKRKRKKIKWKINKKKMIRSTSILVLAIILIFSIIKSTKNKKTNETLASAEIGEETKKEDDMIVVLENKDSENEKTKIEDTSWDEDAQETKVDEKEEKKAQKTGNTKYYIKINNSANVVTIYSKDDEGTYTIPVKAFVCSTGKATPKSGVYKMSSKYRWHALIGGVYGQYCTRITGHILFHSVPYESNSPDSLEYVEYDKLGTSASAGCVRLTVQDAMWIYNNCESGTYVEFYSSSDPGPLGKPSAQKISSNINCRNWDPTDPDSRNPWNGNVENEKNETVQKVDTPTIQTTVEEKKNSEQDNKYLESKSMTNANSDSSSNSNSNSKNTTNEIKNQNTNTKSNITDSTSSNSNTTKDINKTNEKEQSNEISTNNDIENKTQKQEEKTKNENNSAEE